MWAQLDVFGLFSISVGSFLDNAGLSALIFSFNVGTKLRCSRAERFMLSRRYIYFPDLHRPVRELRGKMNVFWGYQRQFLYVDTEAFITDHLELIEENKSLQEEAHTRAWLDMLKITEEIGGTVVDAPRAPINRHELPVISF
jgi:hypothetical protein